MTNTTANYKVKNSNFIYTLPDNRKITLSLRFKTRHMRKLAELAKDGANEFDQFNLMLELMADTETRELIDDLYLDDALPLIIKYFEQLEKYNEATVGELQRSLDG